MAIQDFALSYQISPIIFVGGVAGNTPGSLLPIISITQAADFNKGILEGSTSIQLQDFLFNFQPMPGATIAEFDIGRFPFANQSVAANAIISEPLHISMLMEASVRSSGGYDEKLAVFSGLQSTIQQHAQKGGTYNVATPSYLYTDLILLNLRDVSSGDPMRPQNKWQWDFIQPLLTIDSARAAQNSLMQKINNGSKVTPSADGSVKYSGQGPAVGNAASGQSPSTVPAGQGLSGTSAAKTTTTHSWNAPGIAAGT